MTEKPDQESRMDTTGHPTDSRTAETNEATPTTSTVAVQALLGMLTGLETRWRMDVSEASAKIALRDTDDNDRQFYRGVATATREDADSLQGVIADWMRALSPGPVRLDPPTLTRW